MQTFDRSENISLATSYGVRQAPRAYIIVEMATETNQKTRILAIDYGERYLGLAINTVAGPMPLDTIDIKKANWNVLLQSTMVQHNVEQIIVGISSGNKELAKKVHLFKQAVEALTGKKVHLADESMTSQWAEKKMKDAGAPSKAIKGKSHSLAAYKILDGYLDQLRIKNA